MSAILPNNKFEIKLSHHLPTCERSDSYSVKNVFKKVLHWMEVKKQRKHLARLDDRMLKDIGLSRGQVQVEISKPFWK